MTGILRSCVVLFVDISGSSQLYQELGDAIASKRVRQCLERLRRLVDRRGGRVIKHVGDGLLCDFPDANQALGAAQAMQMGVARGGSGGGPTLGIHVGCHFGPVIEVAGDVFGDTVNIAARVTRIAHAGQILTTQETVERLDEATEVDVRLIDQVTVKGRRDALAIFDYQWHQVGDRTIVEAPPAPARRARLKLACAGREIWLDRSGPGAVTLGRHATCDIAVNDPLASRKHATIEVRGNTFVLVDHSANGTYVGTARGWETCVKRAEAILPDRGRLALGLPTNAAEATVVEFSHEG
jgi:class 3 adenylate cyclase